MPARLIQQVRLDRGFIDAIFPKGMPGLLFGSGHAHAVSVDPDGAANDEMLHLIPQRLHQKTGAIHRVAFIIDDNIRAQISNLVAKGTGLVGCFTVYRDALHLLPGRMGAVRVGAVHG